MMRDHELQEQSVEGYPGSGFELPHVFLGQHARHGHEVRLMMSVDIRDRLTAFSQPVLHQCNLVLLRDIDSFGQLPHHIALGASLEKGSHLKCLGMMRDHPLHKLDVAARVANSR